MLKCAIHPPVRKTEDAFGLLSRDKSANEVPTNCHLPGLGL